VLDSGHSKTGHAAALDSALPAGEFFETQRVALAGLVHSEQATGDSGYDFGLATNHPPRRVRRRKRIERQRFAKRTDDLGRSNFLILEHSSQTCLIMCLSQHYIRGVEDNLKSAG
jgi:hypothetical protein